MLNLTKVSFSSYEHYALIITKIELRYINDTLKTKVFFTPLECHKERSEYISKIVDSQIIKKFKFSHLKILIELNKAEELLDISDKKDFLILVDLIKEYNKEVQHEIIYH